MRNSIAEHKTAKVGYVHFADGKTTSSFNRKLLVQT